MDDIFEYKYEINIKSKHKLTDEELATIQQIFKYRLEGYTTEYNECSDKLCDADIIIRNQNNALTK